MKRFFLCFLSPPLLLADAGEGDKQNTNKMLHETDLNVLLDFVREPPPRDAVFPSSYLLDRAWRDAWRRKLSHACERRGEHGVLVRRNHTLSWPRPSESRLAANLAADGFRGIDFLLETQPHLAASTRRASHETLVTRRDTEIDTRFLDGDFLLDGSIRLLPALGIRPRRGRWVALSRPCVVEPHTHDDGFDVLMDGGKRTVAVDAVPYPEWEFDADFAEAGRLLRARSDLSVALRGWGTFRDPYTLLLERPAVLPSFLSASVWEEDLHESVPVSATAFLSASRR